MVLCQELEWGHRRNMAWDFSMCVPLWGVGSREPLRPLSYPSSPLLRPFFPTCMTMGGGEVSMVLSQPPGSCHIRQTDRGSVHTCTRPIAADHLLGL